MKRLMRQQQQTFYLKILAEHSFVVGTLVPWKKISEVKDEVGGNFMVKGTQKTWDLILKSFLETNMFMCTVHYKWRKQVTSLVLQDIDGFIGGHKETYVH